MKALGIDIGTTTVSGVAVDIETGETSSVITETCNAFLPSEHPWERIQSADILLQTAKRMTETLIDSDTVCIGISGQMHGILYTDANGDAVSPLYTWQDGRGDLEYKGTTYAKALGSCTGYGSVTDLYNVTNGIRPSNAVSYCTVGDYLAMRLCKKKAPVMHASNAASLGCFDIEKSRFNYNCGIDVVNNYHMLGKYGDIPVSVAIGDNQASVFSSLKNEGDMVVNVGTGSQISIVCDRIVNAEGIETRPFFDGKYIAVGAALCGGRAYSVLKDLFSDILSYASDISDDKVYRIMEEAARKADSHSLLVDTRFAGTRQDKSIRGSIERIDTSNLRAGELVLGVLDGIVDELYKLYLNMGIEHTSIIGTGNGIRKNPLLVSAIEERFGAKLKIPHHNEEAAYGAALFSMISCGVKKDLDDAQGLVSYSSNIL